MRTCRESNPFQGNYLIGKFDSCISLCRSDYIFMYFRRLPVREIQCLAYSLWGFFFSCSFELAFKRCEYVGFGVLALTAVVHIAANIEYSPDAVFMQMISFSDQVR